MLSRTAEHALRAVLVLARRSGDPPLSAEQIADALGAPANYLSKTLAVLARRGIVESVRGRNGGFRLALDPDEITVARVVETFDERPSLGMCLLGDRPCNPASPCVAHDCWIELTTAARAPLAATTISSLLSAEPRHRRHVLGRLRHEAVAG